MVSGSSVWLYGGDSVVRGEIICLSPRSIDVAITQPWSGVDSGRSIPYFSCWGRAPEMYYQRDAAITQYGVHVAETLLHELHDGCTLFHSNRTTLSAVYAELLRQNSLRQPAINAAQYRQARADLRKLLRQGTISSVQYQQSLMPLNKHMKARIDVGFEAEAALSRFVRERHGQVMPLGTVKQLILKFLA